MPIRRRGPDLVKVISGIPDRIRQEIPDGLERIGTILESEMKRLLLTPGRGRLRHGNAAAPDQLGRGSFRRVKGVLQRVGRGAPRTKIDLTNRASAPGDPPAPDTLELYRSITHEVEGSTVRTGSPMEKAEPLEFGTTSAGRGGNTVILPRPFVRPAADNTRVEVAEVVVDIMKRGTKR